MELERGWTPTFHGFPRSTRCRPRRTWDPSRHGAERYITAASASCPQGFASSTATVPDKHIQTCELDRNRFSLVTAGLSEVTAGNEIAFPYDQRPWTLTGRWHRFLIDPVPTAAFFPPLPEFRPARVAVRASGSGRQIVRTMLRGIAAPRGSSRRSCCVPVRL